MSNSKDIIEALLDRTNLVFLIFGIALLLFGAAGGITAGNFSLLVNELVWRVVISIAAVLLIGLSIFLIWRDTVKGTGVLSKKVTLSTWETEEFRGRLKSAEELCMIAVSNFDLLNPLSEDLKSFVKRGGKMRCIYLDPEGNAIEMVSARSIGIDKDIESLQSQYSMSIKTMQDIAESARRKDCVQLKKIDYLHGMVLTLVDPNLPEGIAFVTLNGFGHHYKGRPSITLYKQRSPTPFIFLQETFDNMWASPLCEEVNLLESAT